MLVQDDEIDRQALEPPVLTGPQQLLDDAEVALFADAQQHDGQIAGNSMSP